MERRESEVLMRDVFRRVQDAVDAAGLGRVSIGDQHLESLSHLIVAFLKVTDHLAALPMAISDMVTHEGRELSAAVAEYILACYRSRDPNFSLEPMVKEIVPEVEEASRIAVRAAAKDMSLLFERDTDGPDSEEEDEDGAPTKGKDSGAKGGVEGLPTDSSRDDGGETTDSELWPDASEEP